MPIILFAQRGGGEALGALFTGTLGLLCCGFEILLIAASIGYTIWYLMSMYQALDACSPRNRDMEPGMIFLIFIPLFNVVWQFFIVLRVSSSLAREFRARGMRGDGDFGKTIGLWGLILPFTCIGAPAAPICMIMYILRVRAFTAQLAGGGPSSRRDRDDDDDD